MSELYFGHVSTDEEVGNLLDTYGTATPGTTILHKDIAEKIGVSTSETRYRTVTNRWRRFMLSQYNLELRAEPGVGFNVLTASNRVKLNIDDGLRLFKRVGHTVGKLRRIPRESLSQPETVRLDHATLLMARVADKADDVRKEIAPPVTRFLVQRPMPTAA